ncbi:facilitated trehalose transporter Tret1-like [Contarinia nasturtii]|uniref:facilitated trehalose transporter Tret1-like n=1 Tax=Contarinia nasturtii TaxID=265458 RepID=UPI0012D495C5|nr:facilitated trehalose transporter Tret1-like [Contarinia nasturtii]XP_031635410.1 facilitated trehalose transporter Tret1-like [Contarinia nasturtii]
MVDYDASNSKASKTKTQYIAALAATTGAFAAGTTLGWSSPVKSLLVNTSTDFQPEYDFEITSQDFAWIGSLVTLGAAVVCLFIGTILQAVGRKLTMLLLVIPFTVGWILVTFASNLAMLDVGRFLLGISGGAFCISAPTYTSEISEASIRGTLGTYFQLMMVVGVLFPYIIGSQTTAFTLNLMCGSLPIIFGIIFVFIPESPAYLVSKAKTSAAISSLKWLRGDAYDYTRELDELQAQNESEKRNKVSFVAALSRRSTLKAIFISWGLMFFQQASGINAIIFYTTEIFASTGSSIDASLSTIIFGVMQVITVFISSMIVDKLGRRLLLLPSTIVLTLSTFTLGIYFYMRDQNVDSVADIGWLPIVAVCSYIILFSIGIGPIPWIMMGELFANDIKGVAGSLAGAVNWMVAFIVTSTFSAMSDQFGIGQTFWIFSGFSFMSILFVYFFVPETKGKTLTEIQRMLEGEKVNEITVQTKF